MHGAYMQVFTIKLGLMATLFDKYHSKHIVMNVYVINIILVTFITSVYVKLSYNFSGGEGTGNEMGQAVKTVTAGVITILVANFSFLILFGTDEEQQPKVVPSKTIKVEEQ
uniref:Uncharacterized protein n=1 Tax=Dunaliella tertiolecta TaxID=3047 RepID=A0A7S3QM32_DUNTE